MKAKNHIFFVDIDGVLSVVNASKRLEDPENASRYQVWLEESQRYGRTFTHRVWPVSFALQFIRAFDSFPLLYPVWMSVWDESSVLWNQKAGTKNWPSAYHLRKQQYSYIKHHLPDLQPLAQDTFHIDQKLVAACYFLRHYPDASVVWIEDGFAAETLAWACNRPKTKLVDTTHPEIMSFLLSNHEDPEYAAIQFLQRYCRMG